MPGEGQPGRPIAPDLKQLLERMAISSQIVGHEAPAASRASGETDRQPHPEVGEGQPESGAPFTDGDVGSEQAQSSGLDVWTESRVAQQTPDERGLGEAGLPSADLWAAAEAAQAANQPVSDIAEIVDAENVDDSGLPGEAPTDEQVLSESALATPVIDETLDAESEVSQQSQPAPSETEDIDLEVTEAESIVEIDDASAVDAEPDGEVDFAEPSEDAATANDSVDLADAAAEAGTFEPAGSEDITELSESGEFANELETDIRELPVETDVADEVAAEPEAGTKPSEAMAPPEAGSETSSEAEAGLDLSDIAPSETTPEQPVEPEASAVTPVEPTASLDVYQPSRFSLSARVSRTPITPAKVKDLEDELGVIEPDSAGAEAETILAPPIEAAEPAMFVVSANIKLEVLAGSRRGSKFLGKSTVANAARLHCLVDRFDLTPGTPIKVSLIAPRFADQVDLEDAMVDRIGQGQDHKVEVQLAFGQPHRELEDFVNRYFGAKPAGSFSLFGRFRR